MGRKPFKKTSKTIISLSEEEIEDMKNPYWINGKLIYALNEEIAKEIYNRNFSKLKNHGIVMTKKYIIHKGCHYSNFFPRIQLLSQVNYLSHHGCIAFDESCKYEIDESSCVNKLFGFCFGFGVHTNSVRFGWTYNAPTNQIYIWKYFYIDGKLEKEKIFACDVGEQHFYEIVVDTANNDKDTYFIELRIDNKKVYPRNDEYPKIQSNKCFITTLGPYFGGNTRAPHTMKIECCVGTEKH